MVRHAVMGWLAFVSYLDGQEGFADEHQSGLSESSSLNVQSAGDNYMRPVYRKPCDIRYRFTLMVNFEVAPYVRLSTSDK